MWGAIEKSRGFCREIIVYYLKGSEKCTSGHYERQRKNFNLILGFVTILFNSENVMPCNVTSVHLTFLSYNGAMLS